MQGNEAALKTLGLELAERAFGRVKGMCINALRTQGCQHAIAGHERDLALGRHAAHQHGHLAHGLRLGDVSWHAELPE